MSSHEHERLSAWLDDELTAEERAAVDAHLAACAECRARLAEMGAVDALARERPVEAPAGYFDTFAGRVRARLEAEGRLAAPARPHRGGWRPPVWTWAAAAAVILAVVTPLTMMRLGTDGVPAAPEARPTTLREERPTAEAGAGRTPVVPEQEEKARRAADEVEPAAVEPRSQGTPPTAAPAAPAPAPAGTVAPAEAELAEEARDVVGFAAAPPAKEKAENEPSAFGPRRREATAASVAPSEADRPGAGADAVAGARIGVAKGRSTASEEAPRTPSRTSGEGLAEEGATFARLAGSSPEDAAGWRELREAWRAFVAEHPESPRADEARVRTIEAGLEAWRAGGEGEDLARAREDARAYLARDDVPQAGRVRRALERLEER